MITGDFSRYIGSGVLIVDISTSNVLLVYDYSNNYNCCGGFTKYNCTEPQFLEKTAQEELYEETRTLISCDLQQLSICPFVDLNHYEDMFRCYILKMQCPKDICEQFENFVLDETLADDYLETTGIAFFPIEQFRNEESMGKIAQTSQGMNSDGKECPLNKRLISVMKAAINANLL